MCMPTRKGEKPLPSWSTATRKPVNKSPLDSNSPLSSFFQNDIFCRQERFPRSGGMGPEHTRNIKLARRTQGQVMPSLTCTAGTQGHNALQMCTFGDTTKLPSHFWTLDMLDDHCAGESSWTVVTTQHLGTNGSKIAHRFQQKMNLNGKGFSAGRMHPTHTWAGHSMMIVTPTGRIAGSRTHR